MQDNQILSAVADTVLEKATRIEVEIVNPRWWESIGIRLKMIKPVRSFSIKPATLGTMVRISQLLLDIDISPYQAGNNVLISSLPVLKNDGEKVVQAFAAAISNNRAGPSKSLIAFLRNNVTASDLMKIQKVVLTHLNVVPFMNTIILMRGGMSLLKPGEKIASGEQSEA
jgi:hypothetical protein